MPITTSNQLGTTVSLSGSSVPKKLADIIATYDDKPEDMLKMPPKNFASMFLKGDLYSIFFSSRALVCGRPLPEVVGNFLTKRWTIFKNNNVKRNKMRYFIIKNKISCNVNP